MNAPQRGGEAGDEGVDGFTEAAAPGLVGLVGAHGFARDLLNKEAWKCAGDNNRVAWARGAAGRRHFYLCKGWLSALPSNASRTRLEIEVH